MKKMLAVGMVVAGLTSGCLAQAPAADAAKPNFAGTWTLNVAKSDLGQMPAPQSQSETITQTADEVKITHLSDSEMGKQNYTFHAKLDGTETPLAADAFPADSPFKILSAKAEWHGSSLVVTQKSSFQDNTGTLTITYTLSADGKVLTAATHITFGDQGFDLKAVYDKA